MRRDDCPLVILQELSEANSKSTEHQQRVKELEGLLADREVRLLRARRLLG